MPANSTEKILTGWNVTDWSNAMCYEESMVEQARGQRLLQQTKFQLKILRKAVKERRERMVHTHFKKKKNSLISTALQFSSVQFSRSVVSDSLRPHESQHTRPPCPSLTPRVYSNSCPSSQWCHPTISSSVIPFSSCPQSLPASGSFPMSQLFAWGGQSIRVSASASVLPMNTQDWSPLGWTGWISLQAKGLSRVLYNTTVQKHQVFSVQLSL